MNQSIQGNLQYANMYLVFITRDAEEFKRLLLSGEGTYITYSGEKPPEIFAEDEEIANFPIPVMEENIPIIDINEVYESGGPVR